MWNDGKRGTSRVERFMAALADLAAEARVDQIATPPDGGLDARIEWRLADGTLYLDVEDTSAAIGSRLAARTITTAASGRTSIVLAPYISPAARDELRNSGWSYWDETGNIFIHNRDPLVLIRQEGASRDPAPGPSDVPRRLRSLKGQATSIVVVELLTHGEAPSIRALSRSTGVGLATVSRVADLLRLDDLLVDTNGGKLKVTSPRKLATRWAEDYSFEKTFHARRYFSLLGDDIALARLRDRPPLSYALTGVRAANDYLAATGEAVSLPAHETWLYTADRKSTEKALDLSPDPTGNIVVGECSFLETESPRIDGGLSYAGIWRTVGDLLSTRGRMAAVGEALTDTLEREKTTT